MPKAKTPRVNNSPNKQVISMPESISAPAIRKNGGSVTPIDLEGQIRERAYELYEERGRMDGQDAEDWFRAEREVLSRINHQQSA